jgi:hypothetical protein
MPEIFDPEQIEILRGLPAREAFERVKDALYRNGGATSDEFLDAFDEMVALGILTPEQLEEYLG